MEAIDIKAKYPKISKMTVEEVIRTEAFKTAFFRLRGTFEKKFGTAQLNRAYDYLKSNGYLSYDKFIVTYIRVIDKECKLSALKRHIINLIGNNAYAQTISYLIEHYDELR